MVKRCLVTACAGQVWISAFRCSGAPRFRNARNQLDSRAADPNPIHRRDLQQTQGVTHVRNDLHVSMLGTEGPWARQKSFFRADEP